MNLAGFSVGHLMMNWGVVGLIFARILVSALSLPLCLVYFQRRLRIGVPRILREITRLVLATSAMTATVSGISWLNFPSAVALFAKTFLGFLSFTVCLIALWKWQGQPYSIESRLMHELSQKLPRLLAPLTVNRKEG